MEMNFNKFYIKFFRYRLQHYDPEKYWSRRAKVIDPDAKTPLFLKYYYLYYLKKCDAYNNASFASYINYGARFAEPPKLPHGLNGIIIGADTVIGKNCTICQQVTIQAGGTTIGDNCLLGAGAKVLGGGKVRS